MFISITTLLKSILCHPQHWYEQMLHAYPRLNRHILSWCIIQLLFGLYLQSPDVFLSANCYRLSNRPGNTNLLGHFPNAGLYVLALSSPQRWICCVWKCGWLCVFAHLSPVDARCPIDGCHMTTLYKAVSPLKWNTCSAVQQVHVYNSSKNKRVYAILFSGIG